MRSLEENMQYSSFQSELIATLRMINYLLKEQKRLEAILEKLSESEDD
jgi:hypothetical protein